MSINDADGLLPSPSIQNNRRKDNDKSKRKESRQKKEESSPKRLKVQDLKPGWLMESPARYNRTISKLEDRQSDESPVKSPVRKRKGDLNPTSPSPQRTRNIDIESPIASPSRSSKVIDSPSKRERLAWKELLEDSGSENVYRVSGEVKEKKSIPQDNSTSTVSQTILERITNLPSEKPQLKSGTPNFKKLPSEGNNVKVYGEVRSYLAGDDTSNNEKEDIVDQPSSLDISEVKLKGRQSLLKQDIEYNLESIGYLTHKQLQQLIPKVQNFRSQLNVDLRKILTAKNYSDIHSEIIYWIIKNELIDSQKIPLSIYETKLNSYKTQNPSKQEIFTLLKDLGDGNHK